MQAIERGSSNVWQIEAAGEWQSMGQCSSHIGEKILPGQYCFWGSQPFRVYATGEIVNERFLGDNFSSGFGELERAYEPNVRHAFVVERGGQDDGRRFRAERESRSGESSGWTIRRAD